MERGFYMILTQSQTEFLVLNDLSITEENGTYTLHYPNHECSGLSESEIKHILNVYISRKYCSYKPAVKESVSNMQRDD